MKHKVVFVGDYLTLDKLLKDDENYECHLGFWPQDPYVLCKDKESFDWLIDLMKQSKYEIISTFS